MIQWQNTSIVVRKNKSYLRKTELTKFNIVLMDNKNAFGKN